MGEEERRAERVSESKRRRREVSCWEEGRELDEHLPPRPHRRRRPPSPRRHPRPRLPPPPQQQQREPGFKGEKEGREVSFEHVRKDKPSPPLAERERDHPAPRAPRQKKKDIIHSPSAELLFEDRASKLPNILPPTSLSPSLPSLPPLFPAPIPSHRHSNRTQTLTSTALPFPFTSTSSAATAAGASVGTTVVASLQEPNHRKKGGQLPLSIFFSSSIQRQTTHLISSDILGEGGGGEEGEWGGKRCERGGGMWMVGEGGNDWFDGEERERHA